MITMTIKNRRARCDDTGAMLVIALIIITTVALVTGALLTKGATNFRATVSLRGVAGTSYSGDAAAKVAINNLVLGKDAPGWTMPTFPGVWNNWVYTNNADGMGCFGVDDVEAPENTLELPNLYPAAGGQSSPTSARVECSQVPGTGIFGGSSGVGIDDPDPTDAFARALTTVGTSGQHGMTLKPLGTGNNAPMPIRGGVASKSFIDVDNGALVTDGYVWAEGNCTGQIVGSEKVCNSPGKVPMPATPPSPLSSVPTYQDPSTAGCTFQPGFYNNAAALSAATNACGTAYFASGAYYFDFIDADHSGSNIWTINTKVVGGEPTGSGNIPGACRNAINYPSVTGVQFVFGATSRVQLGDTAQVELCGPSNGGEPPMTLYQQQTGTTPAPVTVPVASAATVAQRTGNAGGNKWTTGTLTPQPPPTTVQSAIAAADASNIAWTIDKNNDDVGLDLSKFPGLAGIPVGSDITSAEVRVRYAKSSAKALTVTVTDQTPANVAISTPDASGWGSAQIADQLSNLLASAALSDTRPTLELRLMDASKNDSLTIDTVTLAVTYTPPALRAASNGTFVSATSNFSGKLVVQGAAFMPNGYADMNPGNSTTGLVAFRWGLVAAGVNFKAQPQQLFGYPLVSIPDAGHGLGSRVTVVDLRVFVCVEAGSCTSGGQHALTVRVAITDPPYGASGAPVPGKRKVEILSWAEQH